MADDDKPKTGDTWACDTCGMAILLTEDCNCEDFAIRCPGSSHSLSSVP